MFTNTIFITSHTTCTLCCDEAFFLGLVLKFSRKIKEKEATKNCIQRSKLNEQFLLKKIIRAIKQ